MKAVFAIAALTMASALPAGALAQAGTPADTLGACLVEKSTGGDRIAMMRWMATAVLAAPQLSDLASVPQAARDKADQGAAAVWMRLLTVECLQETKVVMKEDSATGFRVAGEALGRVAMQELMTNTQTQKALSGFTRYLDKAAMTKAMTPK